MPLPIISVAQMREWEKATWAIGQTPGEVIRRVGVAVGHLASQLTRPEDLILILAGKGNNGADARAAHHQFGDELLQRIPVTGVPFRWHGFGKAFEHGLFKAFNARQPGLERPAADLTPTWSIPGSAGVLAGRAGEKEPAQAQQRRSAKKTRHT